jgi:hypothetical protein
MNNNSTNNEIEIKVITDKAETVYISHQKYSYGIFCYNSKGDLFLSSDWGMYGFAWRHYGSGAFSDFLAQTNPEYIFNKFESNHMYLFHKGLPKHVKKPVTALLEAFINYLNQ